MIVVLIFAFVVSLTYSPQAYDAAGKWTKQAGASSGPLALCSVIGIGLPFISLAFLDRGSGVPGRCPPRSCGAPAPLSVSFYHADNLPSSVNKVELVRRAGGSAVLG